MTGADGEEGGSGESMVRLRSLERIRVYRADGSSYSVPYSDVDVIELSADGRELSLLLRGGVIWQVQGESLRYLAEMLDMHAVGALQVTPPADVGETVHYRITSINVVLQGEKQPNINVNVPKRG